jgi:hypothetical protein
MPLWLPTLDAWDAESLLSWQQAPACEAGPTPPQQLEDEGLFPSLHAPPQQLEDEGLLADGSLSFNFGCKGVEDVEVVTVRPFHRTRSSTVAQATVTAATKAWLCSSIKWLRKKSPRK